MCKFYRLLYLYRTLYIYESYVHIQLVVFHTIYNTHDTVRLKQNYSVFHNFETKKQTGERKVDKIYNNAHYRCTNLWILFILPYKILPLFTSIKSESLV